MQKTLKIFLNVIPILIMIGLIPFVGNDYILAVLYAGVILVSFAIKRGKHEMLLFLSALFS